ncbi:MAG TPA: hypothetical protein VFJ72_03455 [Rubrobacteraceae bacterium]|nr:hypothetical protein [Rubrobacteraceae bacterium]
MHGIERHRNIQGAPEPDQRVVRIIVRYADGRNLDFVADASRDFFSEDDILELKKVFDRASSAAEWAEVTERANAGG